MRKYLLALPFLLLAWPAMAQMTDRTQSGQGNVQAAANVRLPYGVVVPGLSKPAPAAQPRPAYKPNPLAARSGGTGD